METPIIAPDTLSATDLFGAATRLVQCSAPAQAEAAVAASNVVFQIVALALIMVYMLFLVRRGNVVRLMIATAIGGIDSNLAGREPINPADRRSIAFALSAIGIITVAMTAVRLTDSAAIGSECIHVSLGATITALTLLALAEHLLLFCAGTISGRSDICERLAQIKLLHFSTAALMILPAAMLYIFSPASMAALWLAIIILQAFASAILFIKESLSLFISQRISILLWILYLCGVELLPASLLLAPFLRGSAGV